MNILKIYFTGLLILIVAILFNFIAIKLRIATWYDFIEKISQFNLSKNFLETNYISLIFLFVIYPIILGLTAFIVSKYLP